MKQALFRSLVGFMFSIGALAETTISQPVARFEYDANSDFFWFVGEAKWGAPSCPNATYIRIGPVVQGYKQMLAIGLSAQMAGKSVRFAGSCHADPNYFNANYVYVE